MATTTLIAHLGEAVNRTLVLPIVMFAPTHRCNSACASCAWWSTASADAVHTELTLEEIDRVADGLARLGTRLVVFTGGEPLLRQDVFEAAHVFKARGMTLHLLTSGIGLAPRIASVAGVFSRVIVSLDSATDDGYLAIRGVRGLQALRNGVRGLGECAPQLPVSARSTIHARNFREMSALVTAAKQMGCSSISFLAADVSSAAFGHRDLPTLQSLRLSQEDVREFSAVLEALFRDHRLDFESGFIAETPAKLRRLAQHFAALNGDEPFPPKSCNAPWISAVIEANGDVRPCFFHAVVGNVRRDSIANIAKEAIPLFRETLEVATNAICARCVCSLKLGWRDQPWA